MSRYRQTFNEAYQQVEKWSKDVEVKSTGEHAGKTIDQLKKEVDALRGKSGNEKEMGGLLFAIRAKQGWKKGEGQTGVEEATQTKHEKGEVKTDKAERGERKAGESEDDYEDRESGGKGGLRPNPFAKKKKQNDLDRDDEAQATRSKVRPTAEEHNCDEVHPDTSHKDWIAQQDEALDTWHPDPEKDRKSTSMKHTAKAVAHHDAQKKKPVIDTRQAAKKIQDILRKQRERKAAQKESNLPTHLSKFLDKKGNPNPEAAKRMAAGKVKRKSKDVTPKGYGPTEETEWAKSKKQDREAQKRSEKQHDEREARYQRQQAAAKKEEVEALDLKKIKADRRARSAGRMKDIEKLFNKKVKPSKDMRVIPRNDATDRGHFEEVEEALGLGGWKGSGTEKMPPVDKKTGKYVTGKTKIIRLPKKEDMSLAPKGKGRKAAKAMYDVKEDLEFKVTIKGIPPFYVPAKTAAAVKQSLRKQLKHPDDIQSIIRVTKAAQKIDYRKRAQGKSDEEDKK